MKTVTLVNSEWFRALRGYERRRLLQLIYDVAEEKNWSVRVGGEHYGN